MNAMTLSQLKKILNDMDAIWDDRPVSIEIDGKTAYPHDVSTTSGLPPIAAGSPSARFYGESPGEEQKLAIMARWAEPKVTVYACFQIDCPGPGPSDGGKVYFPTPECPYCKRVGVRQKYSARISELPRRPASNKL